MNKNYKLNLFPWSKRFAALLPVANLHHTTSPVYLPRFMMPTRHFPRFVKADATAMEMIPKLRLLDWEQVAQPPARHWFGKQPIPKAAYIGAFLVKIDQQLTTLSHLRRFLCHHPALIWALGFPLYGRSRFVHGFDPESCLPTRQQFSRVLHQLDNTCLQAMLTTQVSQLKAMLPASFGQTISLDTKHILAWVKENNPREYIKEGRFDKSKQPAGDPDCKLGCKKQHNRLLKTPAKEGKPAGLIAVTDKEFYWGYASGAVVTKVPDWGEFVLAEMTDTFEKADVRFFFPLMAQVEKRLGFRPPYAALDAAYDSFYVHEFFFSEHHDGFAAVPRNQPNNKPRQFDEHGLPLCEAGLPMPVRKSYNDRTKAIIHHRRAIHACPLRFPQPNGQPCPVNHKQWLKGGCSANLPISIGTRLRHQLDRKSEAYLRVYAQRTAVERIFSQAKALGMERPKLRNYFSIANFNTMTYLLINLRAMQQVLAKLADNAS